MAAQRYQLGSALRTRIRAATGYENNDHVSDSELDTQVDIAARLLLDLYLEAFGPEPYRTTQEINLTPGTSIYDLAQDTYQVLGVYAIRQTLSETEGGAGPVTVRTDVKPWVQLAAYEEHERIRWLNDEDGRIQRLRYRMGGAGADGVDEDRDQVELLPEPTEYGKLSIVYVPAPVLAAVGEGAGDVRVFAPGASSEWIVQHGCAYIRTKEKGDIGPHVGKMQAIEAGIRAAATRRDSNEPARMRGRRRSLVEPRPGDYAEDWQGET